MNGPRNLVAMILITWSCSMSTTITAAEAQASPPQENSTTFSTAAVGGPDVIVADLTSVRNYGSVNGIAAFAVGTTSCNQGDQSLIWIAGTNEHPVIAQNLYRLKDNRFEQIGQSWLKHAFASLNLNECGFGCVDPGTNAALGIGCSDPYTAGLNGTQSLLGPRSEVNAFTGGFPYPPVLNPSIDIVTGRRLQVAVTDLDPSFEGGGLYFVEGQYVTADDALVGNHENNASYRPVSSSFRVSTSTWELNVLGVTLRRQPAINAWQAADNSVTQTAVRVPGEGLFLLAAKATDLGGGLWSYEYAVQNVTSDRSGASFSVPVDSSATITNIGFHDVDYHSGEMIDGTDWSAVVQNGSITWSTVDHATDPLANALRWGTLYNFRFVSDLAPQPTRVTLGLFKPGTPSELEADSVGPIVNAADCNQNGTADSLDIVNGTSNDCNANSVPDECDAFTTTPLKTIRIAAGFDSPVYLTSPPDDLDRLFVVEQAGRIKIVTGGITLPAPFLDISARVRFGGEQGLLSVAFDPGYRTNGRFYVNYTDLSGNTVVSRFNVPTPNSNVADSASEVILKSVVQDFVNHNGGQLQFGPDGYLYVGMGDGGSANDPANRAQDGSSLLGKMLRLDVNAPPDYIPGDNPFVGAGLPLDEIWATGLRNPWRFSFDRTTGDMYIADVGQDNIEEIDHQPASSTGGENYGWRCMEGNSCTGLSGCTCNDPGLTLPVATYAHAGGNCSITGGYVYRGCAMPDLGGTYFYADYCSGFIRTFRLVGGVTDELDRTTELTPTEGPISAITSFGQDASGELYILSQFGDVYKIVPDFGSSVCGNGALEPGEQCDDGNTAAGDGCDNMCQLEPASQNDDCANAIAIDDGTFVFTTIGATTDGPDEPAICNLAGETQVSSDLWYRYTAPCAGVATISLCGSTFDTKLAAYTGDTCPTTASAIACNDDSCSLQSELALPVSACATYLVRAGGRGAAQGSGMLTISCQPDTVVTDCNTNGVEDSADIACGTSPDGNGNGVPDECEVGGDFVRGGRLYDRWWAETGSVPPTSDHPLWQFRPDLVSNTAVGAGTWRCKECHGWDYKGVSGQYATGPHRTGFSGIIQTTLNEAAITTLLTEPPIIDGSPGVLNGHDYGSVLTAGDIADLASFVQLGLIDDDVFIDPSTTGFSGDPNQGEINFTTQGSISCITCHGADGTAINFGTFSEPEYLGTVAVRNPWEFIHKVRMAQPGTPMPSWIADGGTNQGVADIGRYVQLSFPTDCVFDGQCDDGIDCTEDSCDAAGRCVFSPSDALCAGDGLFCNGVEVCDAELGCVSPGNPCIEPLACNELAADCGCGLPQVQAAGPRYLTVSMQPTDSLVPMAILVAPECPNSAARYVGLPSGPNNVAMLVDDESMAARRTPAEWGETVNITGLDIVPNTTYMVFSDCGLPGTPSLAAGLPVTTPIWGDVAGTFEADRWTQPNGVVDIFDITAAVASFGSAPGAPSVAFTDLVGCQPDQSIDIVDIVAVIDGFAAKPYDLSTLCPTPCP